MKVLWSPILLVTLAAVPPVDGEPAPARCEPVAAVTGTAEVVGAVRRQLGQLGVRSSSRRACRDKITARVRGDGTRISLQVEGAGKPVRMVVSNARTAAALIESYARPDLGDSLLRPTASLRRTRRIARVDAPVAAAAAFIAPRLAPVTVARRGSATDADKLSLSLSTDLAFANDESMWQSVAMSITVPVRGFRFGGGARYSQGERFAYRENLLSVDRNAKDLYAVATMPRQVGRVSVEPSLRAGISWLFTERYEPPVEDRWSDVYCMVPGGFDPTGCIPGAPLYVGDGFALANFNLLVGAHLDASVHLWRGFSLAVGGGLDWLPTGGGDARLPPYVQRELELDPSFPAQYFELAAEPATLWRFGIGIRAALQ